MKIITRLSIFFTFVILSFTYYANAHAAQTGSNDKLIAEYIRNKNWPAAYGLAKASNNDTLVKIVLSQQFLDVNYKDNKFEQVISFIKNNPNWPQTNSIKSKAESYINKNTDPKIVVTWFTNNKPLTGAGYKWNALAASKTIKNKETLAPIIKRGWIYGDFTKEEELNFQKQFKQYLTQQDHFAKIENMIWEGNSPKAKQLLTLISNKTKKSVLDAEIAICRKETNSDQLFSKIKEQDYTPGLVFRYLESKKREQPTNKSIELFKIGLTDPEHSSKWSILQFYYAREFFDYQDFSSAYRLLQYDLAKEKDDIRETKWLSGWIALRFLKKPDLAIPHFEKLLSTVSTPISLSRGYYWLGRSYDAQKKHEKAKELYKSASLYGHTFYGQLASVALNDNRIHLAPTPTSHVRLDDIIKKNEHIRAVDLLVKLGLQNLAHVYAKCIITNSQSEPEIIAATKLIAITKDIHLTVCTAKVASQNQVLLKEYSYPTPKYSVKHNVELPLVYAIIRQESVFDKSAVSHAQAHGLMQLIKDTACATAKQIKVRCDVSRLTKDDHYNVQLGAAHLEHLLKKRRNSYILTIASYNTNPASVDAWFARFGDPREMKKLYDVIDWIELIPYNETRNYVQRVLENLQVYRAILSKSSILKIKQDIMVN